MSNIMHWTVPADHPVFAGHFPGTPIFPGVMLLDTVLHSIAADTGITLDTCEISAVKFLSPARPGDALVIQYTITANGGIRFNISAGARAVASGSIAPRSPP